MSVGRKLDEIYRLSVVSRVVMMMWVICVLCLGCFGWVVMEESLMLFGYEMLDGCLY